MELWVPRPLSVRLGQSSCGLLTRPQEDLPGMPEWCTVGGNSYVSHGCHRLCVCVCVSLRDKRKSLMLSLEQMSVPKFTNTVSV